MYADLDAVFRAHLSGTRAQQWTARITEYYRSPGSSGYRAATAFVTDAIREAGAEDVTEERYPLDGETQFLGRTMPPAWEPIEAELDLVAPRHARLVSFEETPSTLPWWSGSTADDGEIVEVVDVGRGLSRSDYAAKAVRRNAVLIRDSESRPAWAHAAALAKEHGAAGIITDFLHSQTRPWRTREALPDAVQLLRLAPAWENPWAFAVGYDVAEMLSAAIRRGPVRVRARALARTFKGQGINVMASIAGSERPEETVLFIAHTSAGTKPCANCAAGPALMIELCRAITSAIRSGNLRRPARSIRFLFVAEGMGSAYFLTTQRDSLSNIKAAICLDSVGHSQSRLKSSLINYRSPDSIPSYVNDLTQALIEELPKEADWPFLNGPVIPLVNFQTLPYTPWSDNHYWAGLRVPAPLFMSWPDLYFHTQLLTADNTDPVVFERSGRVLGSLAVGIARAGESEAGPIMQEIARRAGSRLGKVTRTVLQRMEDGARVVPRAQREIRYLLKRDAEAIYSALDLVGAGDRNRVQAFADRLVADLRVQANAELDRLKTFSQAAPDPAEPDGECSSEADELVPSRPADHLPPGVVGLTYDEQAELVDAMRGEDARVNWETLRILSDELWNFADGTRTLRDIADAICFEFGLEIQPKHILTMARGFQRAGVFALDRQFRAGRAHG
jgi:aminopeptidase YwaD